MWIVFIFYFSDTEFLLSHHFVDTNRRFKKLDDWKIITFHTVNINIGHQQDLNGCRLKGRDTHNFYSACVALQAIE